MINLAIFVAIMIFVHFIYESSVAPTLRIGFRNDLFILRDKLRLLRESEKINKKQFLNLQSSINVGLSYMSSIDIMLFFKFKSQVNKDPELKKQIDSKVEEINESETTIAEFYEISRALNVVIFKVMIVNSFMIFIWLLPLILLLSIVTLLLSGYISIRVKLKKYIQRFVNDRKLFEKEMDYDYFQLGY